MKKPKQIKLIPIDISDYFTPTKKTVKTENTPKVTMAFRCDLILQQEISRLSKEAETTPSELVRLIIEDAIKNKVEVTITTDISIKYNNKNK